MIEKEKLEQLITTGAPIGIRGSRDAEGNFRIDSFSLLADPIESGNPGYSIRLGNGDAPQGGHEPRIPVYVRNPDTAERARNIAGILKTIPVEEKDYRIFTFEDIVHADIALSLKRDLHALDIAILRGRYVLSRKGKSLRKHRIRSSLKEAYSPWLL